MKGRAVLLLSSSAADAAARVVPGRFHAHAAPADRQGQAGRVGSTRWYLRRGSGARHVFRVTGGKVREVGLADARQTASRARAKRLFASFR